ncbi:YTH domain-containing protein ECT1 [Diospyros lotus]|uniref:YTH domain-containing protein ECT1 n=1 Tax=Diospyros lotus TaxID=55363 RepID=UPI00224F07F6|nr:YTH domain-containing protein ECT1 [Diospyros lotus]
MAGEKEIEKSEAVAAELKSDTSKLAEQTVASRKDGTSSISSSVGATSSINGETAQELVAEHDVHYPPTSCYDYYYPGYNGTFSQVDNHNYFNAGAGSYTGFQSDNGSLVYYLPGYNPYGTGSFVGADGQQQYYSSQGYLQHPVSHGSEAMSCYSGDSTYVGNVGNGTTGSSGKAKPIHGSSASMKADSCNSKKLSSTIAGKYSTMSFDSKPRKSTMQSMPVLEGQNLKTFGKLGGGYQSASVGKGYNPVGKFSSYMNQNPGFFMHNSPMNHRAYGRGWSGNNRTRDRRGEFNASSELTRGPRAQSGSNLSNSSAGQELLRETTVWGDQYNLEEFQTEYENAKFFVIKSYSEDDVHKSIKYDVWSSTPNGNRKLDAAFHDAKGKASETGTQCPVFLFFSVNASGQFVGVAEMVGPVDFNKDMDFWQLDKWNGFFPVKWHIVKDVPNTQLLHIILENNENKPVTHSRDTQEIGLKEGVEMLNIFKSYAAKTSMLNDLSFYEDREKLLQAKRSNKVASLRTEVYGSSQTYQKQLKPGGRTSGEAADRMDSSSDPAASLVNLTKNLSLNPQLLK